LQSGAIKKFFDNAALGVNEGWIGDAIICKISWNPKWLQTTVGTGFFLFSFSF